MAVTTNPVVEILNLGETTPALARYLPSARFLGRAKATGDATGGVVDLNFIVKAADQSLNRRHFVITNFEAYTNEITASHAVRLSVGNAQWNVAETTLGRMLFGAILTSIETYSMLAPADSFKKPIYLGQPQIGGSGNITVRFEINTDTKIYVTHIEGLIFDDIPVRFL